MDNLCDEDCACIICITHISRSGHSLTLNISEMATDTAIVTIEGNRKSYPSCQVVPFSVILSDIKPTFQGHDNIQRQITRLIVSRV